MKTGRILQAFALLFYLGSYALADTLKNPTEARELADRAMKKVGEGDLEGGLLLTKPFLNIPVAEFEVALNQMRAQTPAMTIRFGKSIGFEFISQSSLGESLLRFVYIHRFETHAMRWSFIFYRTSKGWVLDTFKTDDDPRQWF